MQAGYLCKAQLRQLFAADLTAAAACTDQHEEPISRQLLGARRQRLQRQEARAGNVLALEIGCTAHVDQQRPLQALTLLEAGSIWFEPDNRFLPAGGRFWRAAEESLQPSAHALSIGTEYKK